MCQLEVAWLSLSPLRHPTLVMTFSFLPPPPSPPPYIHSRRVYIRRNIRIVYLRTVIPASSGLHSPLSSRHDWYPHPHSARLLTKWIIKILEWDHRTLQKLGTAAAYLHLQKMDGNQSQHSSKYGTSSNFLPTHWSHGHWISILIKECGLRESLLVFGIKLFYMLYISLDPEFPLL